MVIVIFITYYRRRPLIVCNKVFASALDSSVQGLWAAAPKAEWRPRRQAAMWCDRRALACGCHSAPLCSTPSVRTKQPLVSLDQPAGQWVLGHLVLGAWALDCILGTASVSTFSHRWEIHSQGPLCSPPSVRTNNHLSAWTSLLATWCLGT